MAGAILERQLTATAPGGIKFAVARRTDDAEIRRLLRENPMAGGIRLSLEREPDFFADEGVLQETRRTIIARDGARVVCVGSCTVRQRFVNGEPCRVGYLGGLRLDRSCAGRYDIIRRGYEFFRDIESDAPADFYFTSIASENERARNFLEHGLRGMPRYEFVGEFVALTISVRACRALGKEQCKTPEADRLVPFLNEHNRMRQFAPCWESSEIAALQKLGLGESGFCIVQNGQQMVACGAVWDQRCFKQAVVRGYAASLQCLRPVLNAWARLAARPRLPAVNHVLANAFVSHLVAQPKEAARSEFLFRTLADRAHDTGVELLTFGFPVDDPQLNVVRTMFACREYRSRLYMVRWPGIGQAVGDLDGRMLAPEIALL